MIRFFLFRVVAIQFLISFFFIVHSSWAYTTEDGKVVPPLEEPWGSGTATVNSAQVLVDLLATDPTGLTILMEDGEYNFSGITGDNYGHKIQIKADGVSIRGKSGDPTKVIFKGNGFESCKEVDEEMIEIFAANITIGGLQ